ncbi:unnamed protein product [Protopolystoma xenopodis]|uniref:Uncharacterized protein n=1 Tax=Protopolystoma xenopodis TaxID=117903 RepID=A0A3S5A1H2_9PLAT|nr:unnamed protein product [Protopolystoma xenopodis]
MSSERTRPNQLRPVSCRDLQDGRRFEFPPKRGSSCTQADAGEAGQLTKKVCMWRHGNSLPFRGNRLYLQLIFLRQLNSLQLSSLLPFRVKVVDEDIPVQPNRLSSSGGIKLNKYEINDSSKPNFYVNSSLFSRSL